MKVLMTLITAALFTNCYGQKVVSGKVIDECGHPVPFASIQSTFKRINGTSADMYGNFKLDGIFERDTLTCSHINFQDKKEQVLGNNTIIFQLIKQPLSSTQVFVSATTDFIAIKTTPIPVRKDSIAGLVEDENKLFDKVEVAARFPGGQNGFRAGDDGFRNYLERKIVFPDSSSVLPDATDVFAGRITVRFTIDKTGQAGRAAILSGINEATDQLVVNTINNMPLWDPAIQNGREIESEREVSIYFHVQQKRRYR